MLCWMEPASTLVSAKRPIRKAGPLSNGSAAVWMKARFLFAGGPAAAAGTVLLNCNDGSTTGFGLSLNTAIMPD